MRFAGKQSWQVCHGSAQAMDMALYLRDTLALSVDTRPVVPSLDPAVPVSVPAGVDRAAVAREWPGWWADVLEWCGADAPLGDDPRAHLRSEPAADTSPALANRPALRGAVAALFEPAARYWSTLARRAMPPSMRINEIVRDLERELGRPAKPFRLVITEVRVQDPMWEPLTATHVLASQRFVESEAGMAALRQVLAPLA
jgi:hypothetical protein